MVGHVSPFIIKGGNVSAVCFLKLTLALAASYVCLKNFSQSNSVSSEDDDRVEALLRRGSFFNKPLLFFQITVFCHLPEHLPVIV